MLDTILLILVLLTSVPIGFLLNHLTKDEKYLKKFILIVSIVCLLGLIIALLFKSTLIFLTLFYMFVVSLVCYLRR